MKAMIPSPIHESYQKHRQQVVWQIILPMVLTGILFIAVIVLINIATFRDNGDVTRWAAVSTIWISIPIIIAGFLFFVILAGIAYLLIRLLQIAPVYTGRAQDFAYTISGYVKRAADAAVRPVFFLDEIGATLKALLGRR